jgi:hypothetical protein
MRSRVLGGELELQVHMRVMQDTFDGLLAQP